MKKFLVGVTALALIFGSSPASAELLKNLRLSGQIDIQATAARNVSDYATAQNSAALASGASVCLVPGCAVAKKVNSNNDRIGDAQTRVMVHLDWDLLDDVHSRVTFGKNNRNWGNQGGAPGGAADAHGNATSETVEGGGALGQVFVDEAYFKIDKVAGQVDATFGRQVYGDAGDLVIYYGPSDKAEYGLPINALDAARFDWGTEDVAVTGVVAKQAGSSIGTIPQADTDVRGLNILFKGNDNFHASLYGWNRLTHATGPLGSPPNNTNAAPNGGKNDNLFVVGLKMKLAGGGFWYKGEFDQNFGENRAIAGLAGDQNINPDRHYIGWATLNNAGWRGESDNLGSLSIWGEIGVGSGLSSTREARNDGFVAINSDYRPGSIYGRFAANAAFGGLGSGLYNAVNTNDATGQNSFVSAPGLSNRIIWGSGIKMSPAVANKLMLAVSWWDYRLHRFATLPGAGNFEPYSGNRHIGAELDVDLVWTHSENVAFATGWGTFQPGGLIQQAAQANEVTARANPGTQFSGQGVNPVTLAYFDVRVKF